MALRIVIIGGGFAGVNLAKKLGRNKAVADLLPGGKLHIGGYRHFSSGCSCTSPV